MRKVIKSTTVRPHWDMAEDMPLTLVHYTRISNTPALPLAVEAWHWFNQQGYSGGEIAIGWDHEALTWETSDGKAVAVLTFKNQEWNNTCEIGIGFVDMSYRRVGLYRQLYEEVKKIAVEKGMLKTWGGRHINNTYKRLVDDKMGRTATFISVVEKLPGKTDANKSDC